MSEATPRRRSKSLAAIPFPAKIPFIESLGIELHAIGDGRAELRVDLDEAHLNTWEVAHGGVVMTMLDVAMAMAARSANAHGTGVATVEMKTSFMRPAEHQLRAVGKLLHKTTTLAFCEAMLYDDLGKLCASATGTFKYLRGLPARGRVTTQTLAPSADPDSSPDSPADSPPDTAKDDTP